MWRRSSLATRSFYHPVSALQHTLPTRRIPSLHTIRSSCRPSPPTHASRHAFHDHRGPREPHLGSKMVESAATTFASIFVLAAGFAAAGYIYHKSYKRIVLQKITNAFEPGDPVLELAAIGKDVPKGGEDEERWIHREEQSRIDRVVAGQEPGHYYLLIGEKGTGKSSMILEAMRKIDGTGVAMVEGHADPEIFRIRLGKALDYEFHEDYIGGYFSERGPRETTAILDIERALNKLEKVALLNRTRRNQPLIVIINQMHLIQNDVEGANLISLLQQRAEQWAAANLVTMIFMSDHYWVYEKLKLLATRMEVLSISDLPKRQAIAALAKYRQRFFQEQRPSPQVLEKVYERVGGRLSFLNRVAKSPDMLAMCDRIKDTEKQWFLNKCWILGEPMDDDVMDQQKWASAAMVLALALVDKEGEMDSVYSKENGHNLPSFPFHVAQQIQTRCDFIRELDNLNIFAIRSDNSKVSANSVPMQRAFREVCSQPGFRQLLDDTLERIAAIESLGRTRELVAKDLVQGGKYILRNGNKAQNEHGMVVELLPPEEKDEKED